MRWSEGREGRVRGGVRGRMRESEGMGEGK